MKVTGTDATTHYYVTDDERGGRSYDVVHRKSTGNHCRETWDVYSYIGNNYGKHCCDPDKPTYKRVMEKLHAVLINGGLQ